MEAPTHPHTLDMPAERYEKATINRGLVWGLVRDWLHSGGVYYRSPRVLEEQ